MIRNISSKFTPIFVSAGWRSGLDWRSPGKKATESQSPPNWDRDPLPNRRLQQSPKYETSTSDSPYAYNKTINKTKNKAKDSFSLPEMRPPPKILFDVTPLLIIPSIQPTLGLG